MELPLYFTIGKTFFENYDNFSSQYIEILKETNVDVGTIRFVKRLTTKLRETVEKYLNGEVESAFTLFKKAMKLLEENPMILPIKTIEERTFYRMRAEDGITDEKEFYHVPFDKSYLSRNERFSIDGYPCLYLGYSKRVCEIEVTSGTLAKFTLKEPIKRILDLTLGQGEGKKDISEIQLVKVFPLIASCYIVPFYSTLQKKECRPDKSFFHEEYIIPQLLTQYLKEEGIANGIIYYSVKDPNLKPYVKSEEDFRNLVLFTNRDINTGEKYDNELIGKFEITL